MLEVGRPPPAAEARTSGPRTSEERPSVVTVSITVPRGALTLPRRPKTQPPAPPSHWTSDEGLTSKERPSVRDIARMFESEVDPQKPPPKPKRVGKHRFTRQGTPAVHVGIVRKKSSLKKKKSQSHGHLNSMTPTDVRPLAKAASAELASRSSLDSLPSSSPHPSISSVSIRSVSRSPQPPPISPKPKILPMRVSHSPSPSARPVPPPKPALLRGSLSPSRQMETTSTAPSTGHMTSSHITSPVPPKPPLLRKPHIEEAVRTRPVRIGPIKVPPPPPAQPPSKARIHRKPSINRSTQPRRSVREQSSEDETYQTLNLYGECYGAIADDFAPRVPSLPPPSVPPGQSAVVPGPPPSTSIPAPPPMGQPTQPTLDSPSSSEDIDVYEEIGQSGQQAVRMRECTPEVFDEPDESAYAYETRCTRLLSCTCSTCMAARRHTHWMAGQEGASSEKIRRKSRPASSLELDRLIPARFKSELSLNVKKVHGFIRSTVDRRRAKTKERAFTVDAEGLRTDEYAAEWDDDRYIYGDDWSSDEDDVIDPKAADVNRSSLYMELEGEMNKLFPRKEGVVTMRIPTPTNELEAVENEISRLELTTVNIPDSPLSDDPLFNPIDSTTLYTSRLPDEQPLYQIYLLNEQEKLVEEATGNKKPDSQEDRPTPVNTADEKDAGKPIKARRCTASSTATTSSSSSTDSGRGADCSTSTSALTSSTSMRRERLVAGSHYGSQRSLWCELPEVKAAGLLDTLDEDTKQLQEAYFEVITSEASYLRSLNILITHFMACSELLGAKSPCSVISNEDRKHLFSNIFAVRDCSERLLCELEARLESSLVLDDVSDILADHFQEHFDAYVKYCSNQVYQDRTLRRLKTESPAFMEVVTRLESDRQCQGLDMRSFLMLPMQRVTRYPLLVYAIFDRQPEGSERRETARQALEQANSVVTSCNEGARRMERTEQLLDVDRRLVYKDADLKRIPLVTNGRYLIKHGPLLQLVERRGRGFMQKGARTVYVFLFNDLLLVAKKKLNGTFVCKDYAARRFVELAPIESDSPKIPIGALSSLSRSPHLLLCALMKNARGRHSEMLLVAESETDRERWISAVRPPACAHPDERVYADWDCPQAIAVHPYARQQDDELELAVGDQINILRKMPDGWFYGEKARDGSGGWFPSSYVHQIINDHVRANNYRQRFRMIQAATAGNFADHRSRGPAPLMTRLRRMSNPKSFFNQVNQ